MLNDTGVDCEMCYQVAFWEANDFGGRAWERGVGAAGGGTRVLRGSASGGKLGK